MRRLDALVRDHAGVVLAGPTGVGKTALARRSADLAAAQGIGVVRITGTAATGTVRFGAFAPYLPARRSLTRDPLDEATLLRTVASELVERASGKAFLLLVDDAQHLDEASATLVHQLAQMRAAVVVATVQSGVAVPDPVVALWKDRLVERLDLDVLPRSDIDALLQAVLGGPVDGAAVRQLADRSGGNPLFLRELVTGGLEAGDLRNEDGMWCLSSSMRPSPRLVELMEHRLRHLSPDERRLLELVALCEPLGRAELTALADPATIEALEHKQVVTSRLDRRRLQLWPTHPLFGAVAREWLTPLGQLDLLQRRVEVFESYGLRRREDPLLVASWRLVVGGGRADVLEAGALAARARNDPELARRLATAAVDAGAGFTARFTAAESAFLLGDASWVNEQLAALRQLATTDVERGRVAVLEFDTAAQLLGRLDPARLAELEATISDPELREEVLARRMGALWATRGFAATVEVADTLLARPGPVGASFAHLIGCYALAAQGRLRDAMELWSRTSEELSETTSRLWYEGTRHRVQAHALVSAGRLAKAEAALMTEYDRALRDDDPELLGPIAAELAMVRLEQGRVRSASLMAKEATRTFQRLGRDILVRQTLVSDVLALALSGDGAGSANAVAALEALSFYRVVDRSDQLEARAWAAVAAGDLPHARELLEAAATNAEETGNRLRAVSALHGVARLGRARDVHGRVAALAARMEGDFVRARFAHVDALSVGNIDELERAGQAFEELGANLYAAEAFADAAVAHRRRGEGRAAAAAAQRAALLAARCEGAVTPALQGIGARAQLAPSEFDTARLAAAGHSNRAIAARLGISVRTVENRLQRVYEKLGVSGRQELTAVLSQFDQASQ
jgi:DNA-binding CsgD family transcriptional regulator